MAPAAKPWSRKVEMRWAQFSTSIVSRENVPDSLCKLLVIPDQRSHQCENRMGTGGFNSKLLVAPPRTNSRKRECPYAPITSISDAWEAT